MDERGGGSIVPRIVLTGGGGHLGRELVAQLQRAGMQVVALRRDGSDISLWPTLCEDVDVVVHLAAPTTDVDTASADDALRVTRRLFEALPGRPLSFVFAGSMALFRPPAVGEAIDEGSPVYEGVDLSGQDAYTRMKAMQEQLVRTACRSRGDRLTILRPSNVWDAGRWQQACVGPKVGPMWFVVAPARRLRLIHLGNCARAFVEAVRARPDATVELNIDDGGGISAWTYATRVAGWRRHAYLPIPVPGWLFDAVTSLAGRALRAVAPERRMPGLLIAQRRAARFGGYRIDTRRAREQLGWQPDLGPYGRTARPA